MRVLSLFLALWIPAAAQVAPTLNLVVVEGEGAVNNIKQRTAREPIVRVQDENHKPVGGAVVILMLPSNGAGGTFANGAKTLTMTTDNQGQAVARGLKPNGIKGQCQIRVNASHGGQNASVSITQTNAVLSATGAAAVLAVVGAAAAGGAYATHSGGATRAVSLARQSAQATAV